MLNFRRAIIALFCLACISSMAGMEIFGWLSFALALFTLVTQPRSRALLAHPVLIAAYGLVLWVGFGLWWNSSTLTKPWAGFGEMRWVLSLIGLAINLRAILDEPKDFSASEKLIRALTVVATLISVYSITQYWTGYDLLRGASSPLLLIEESRTTGELRYRPYGLFKMTLTYACSYAMFGLLPFTLSFLRQRHWFWLGQAAAGVIFLSVFMTFSRGVWISLGTALIFVLWFASRKALVALPFVVAALAGLSLALSPVLRARVNSVTDSHHESNSERMDLWRANLLMFKTHPIVGVGYEQNGPPTVDEYYRALGIASEFKSHAHNNYLNFLSGTGLPGFLCYLAFILGALTVSFRNYRSSSGALKYLVLATIGSQIVLHVGGLTEYNFGDAEVQYQYLFYVAFNLALGARRDG